VKASEGDERPLEVLHAELVEEQKIRLRGKRHDVTTNKGVVAFLNEALNAFVLDPSGDTIGREELNTIGYVCGIQLKAIAAVQSEDNPDETISDILKAGGQVQITMTKDERKAYLTAGSVEGMQRVLSAVKKDGRIVELEAQPDGSFGIPPKDEPPRSDAKMPAVIISQAMSAEGVDITTGEVLEIFGSSLGSPKEQDLSVLGFGALMDVTPVDEPALGHIWGQITVHNPDMPGVVTRRNRCTKCGITTNNTSKHNNEPCEVFGTEDVFRE
jgi:hypothetical protein